MKRRPIKVCYVVCNKHLDYVRTEVMAEALSRIKGVETLVIKNRRRGLKRYPEVIFKLPKARLGFRPDLFIVGFRGYEIFWFLYPAMIGKPKIFDEFVNFHDWAIHEHHKFSEGSLPARLLDFYMRRLIGRCRLVLMDTPEHAKLCAANYRLPPAQVKALPVGADENLFYPRPTKAAKGPMEVFFFGNMLALHGIDVMLGAINQVLASPDGANYHFTLAGGQGSPKMLRLIDKYIKASSRPAAISHHAWIKYDKLPDYIAKADLCLGGPFGDTGQAMRVISGKTYQFIAMAKAAAVGDTPPHNLFKDKVDCLKVPLGDETELAATIAWAYQHRDQLPTIGRAARELYIKEYSIDQISSQLQAMLSEIV